ncbi:MAG: polymerase subunit alpha, partial [Pseudonocardiales bacterium]|nr:polymerase subunit alpha [Pseudonocardiales bacterium]
DDAAALGGVFDIPVPDEHWPAKHQLAVEREMLGLYVSGHPLNGLEALLAAKTDTQIPTVLAGEVADGAQVTVGGLLTGVNRRVNKNGEPWASAQLEDLAGGIEVLFFPRTYTVVGTDIAEDAVVLVKARVNRRDDKVSLIANDLALPDLTAATTTTGGAPTSAATAASTTTAAGAPTGPLEVSLRADHCTPRRVAELKAVLGRHPGQHEVHLRLLNGTRATVLKLDDGLRVNRSPALLADLKALLGPGCLT